MAVARSVVYTGALLATESAWYSAMASYYKNNPYVWFGTNNEPATAGGSLSDWQLATYNAIRNTGNKNPILLEPSGSRPTGYGGAITSGDEPGRLRRHDQRHLGSPRVWLSGRLRHRQASPPNDALVAASQTIQSADGVVPASSASTARRVERDAIVTAVINAGASGKTGSAAWVWDTQGTVGGPSGDPTGTTYGGR